MADNGFKVRIISDHAIEVSRGGTRLRLGANLRDHELYVDDVEVTGPALPPADLDAWIGAAYRHLNVEREMQVDFTRRDGSVWGEPQGWQARPYTPEDGASARRGFWGRLFGR